MEQKKYMYSDLSKKQLQNIKELYIQNKVNSMSDKELKEFALEIISHQIIETIGKEEEVEAWEEMSDFFGEEFEKIILEIQQKYTKDSDLKDHDQDAQKMRKKLLEINNIESEKKDMWDD